VKQPKISVIIPVKNVADKMDHCLEAIFSQSTRPDEVIIVDGHSVDRTLEKAKKYDVRIFHQDYGAAGAARQIGLESAEGEFVAFTDGDCIPDKEWLRCLITEFKETVVGVGGRIENIGKGLWIRSINLAFATFLGSGMSIQGRTFKNKRFVRTISGCNSMYRKDDLIKVGGFNPDLSGADETELNARLLKIGKLLYTPSAVVFHDHSRGLKKFAQNMYNYGGWRREIRVWDLPIIPVLLAPFLVLTLMVNYWILLVLIGGYLVIIGSAGLIFAIREKNLKFIISIPIVFIVEHLCYTIGFWKEVVHPRQM